MKKHLLGIIFSLFAAQSEGRLEVVVGARDLGSPLAGVSITIAPATGQRPILKLKTDANGVSQTRLPVGEYKLTAERPGYFGRPLDGLPQSSETRSLTVVAGENHIRAELAAGGAITGQVTTTDGAPLSNVTIAAFQWRYDDGQLQPHRISTVVTNANGEYRLYWLPPGPYLVGLDPLARPNGGQVTITKSDMRRLVPIRTFYPGTDEPESAAVVPVQSATDTTGINFSIITREAFKISGQVENDAQGGALRSTATSFVLISKQGIQLGPMVISNRANLAPPEEKARGRFILAGVPPGSYEMYATSGSELTASGDVILSYSDVDNVVLHPVKFTALSGRVMARPGALPSNIVLYLKPRIGYGQKLEVRPDSRGEFRVSRLPVGNYRLDAELPPDYGVGGIFQDGQEVTTSIISAASGSISLIEVIIQRGVTILGSVRGSVVGENVSIVLAPDASRRENRNLYRLTHSDELGRFSLSGVLPGRYRIFAWGDVPSTAWFNAEFLMRNDGTGFNLDVAGENLSDVQVISSNPN